VPPSIILARLFRLLSAEIVVRTSHEHDVSNFFYHDGTARNTLLRIVVSDMSLKANMGGGLSTWIRRTKADRGRSASGCTEKRLRSLI